MSLQNTPRANRLHIGLYGQRNSGKSSLLNALTGQQFALVSDVAGTTTDPVYKSMELHGVGPVVWIDTAGFDDEGQLGALRVQKTEEALARTDIALLLFSEFSAIEQEWLAKLKAKKTPVIPIINKADVRTPDAVNALTVQIEEACGEKPLLVSAATGEGVKTVRDRIVRLLPEDYQADSIVGHLVQPGDTVLLVMPQDIQAPKGRLILPQVQTIRELLDRKCTVVSTTADGYETALERLKCPPDLIITDSQCFSQVYEKKPAASALTSFSILMAASKGDLDVFIDSVSALDKARGTFRVLIAEACTHVPLQEDIGTIKIPMLLRKQFGEQVEITNVRGNDFPKVEELKQYDLIIHCGACMFNRRHVLSRIAAAQEAGVPMTNYGIFLAYAAGILDKIQF